MNCPTCQALIPDNRVACPLCTSKLNDEALAAAQASYLPKILDGKDDLRTALIGGQRHVRMFGTEITFCNKAISRGNKRGYLPWDQLDKSDVCTQCRIRVRAVAQEVAAA